MGGPHPEMMPELNAGHQKLGFVGPAGHMGGNMASAFSPSAGYPVSWRSERLVDGLEHLLTRPELVATPPREVRPRG